MNLQQLYKELARLNVLYEDAVLRHAPLDEMKKILDKINDLKDLIAAITG